jgi:hypothetical protein
MLVVVRVTSRASERELPSLKCCAMMGCLMYMGERL